MFCVLEWEVVLLALMRYHEDIGESLRDMMEHNPAFRSIAYFSMEIGLESDIPTYAGGLGILAGDILRSAADLGLPMVGVTLLYRQGYFHQIIDENGWQLSKPQEWNPEDKLELLPNEVVVNIEGRPVRVRTWCYEVMGSSGYHVPVYLLDTDFDGNAQEDRKLTGVLYGGDLKYRLCQEMILGIGGLRMLRELGYSNIRTFHLNEGHAGFLTLELIRELGFEDYDRIREQLVFTTHTPVPAGIDRFPYELIERVMSHTFAQYLRHMVGPDGVSMVDIGLRYSHLKNAVSKKHAEVSRNLFNDDSIIPISNGVHSSMWTCSGLKKLFDEHIPGWANDPGRLILALKLSDEDVWRAHQAAKMRLLARILEDKGEELDPEKLTIGFARRFATYKRADLMFKDVKRLVDICSGQVQFVFSGKAHPNDEEGKAMLQRIYQIAKEINSVVPIVFLENYDMELAHLMTSGCDLWLNTPLRPREASGTSGMKAAHNGVLNLSTLDGWWIEGWIEDATGWAIGPEPNEVQLIDYDESQDAMAFYMKLEDKVMPTYYRRRERWVSMMKQAIALNASYFNSHRTLKEYCEMAYGIAFRGL